MNALSIRQPWAWLIIHGGKDIENRDWPTAYRWSLLIHAGLRLDVAREAWEAMGVSPGAQDVRTGGIIGMVTLVDCVCSSRSRWFVGPWGFVLADASPVQFHPYRGSRGIFWIPDELCKNMCVDLK